MKALTLAVAAVALLAASAAHADTIPPIYFGQWCGDIPHEPNEPVILDQRLSPPSCKEFITIDKTGMTAGSITCRWTRVRYTGSMPKPMPHDWVPGIDIKAWCTLGEHFPRRFRLQWAKRDQLVIRWTDR